MGTAFFLVISHRPFVGVDEHRDELATYNPLSVLEVESRVILARSLKTPEFSTQNRCSESLEFCTARRRDLSLTQRRASTRSRRRGRGRRWAGIWTSITASGRMKFTAAVGGATPVGLRPPPACCPNSGKQDHQPAGIPLNGGETLSR